MKPVLRHPRLGAGLFLVATLPAAIAQAQPADADYELITTAIHKPSSETALPVTVLSGDELHEQSRATLGDTLASQPGISNASFGPAVGQTVIRGQSGRRVMNMTNAIPNADASGNSTDHALTIEAILADAVEVLRGPSTLLYGGGAIGGVVNVIDNRIPREPVVAPGLSLEARHDSASDQDNLIGRLDFATGDFSWHLDGLKREWNDLDIPGLAIAPGYLDEEEHEHEEEDHDEEDHDEEEEHAENTDGFVANTGGETSVWTAGGAWHFGNGFIGLAVSKLDNLYGLPPGAHEHAHEEEHEDEHMDEDDEDHEEHEEHEEENIRIDMQSTRYDLNGEWNFPGSLIERVDYKLGYTDYTHSELEGPGVIGTTFSNETWQQRLQLSHRELSGFHGVLGLQHVDEEFGAVGEESFIPVTDITSTGLFLVEDIHTGSLTWEFGARVGRYEYDPHQGAAVSRSFNTGSLSASALWDASSTMTIGLSLSRSQRAPSIEELYSNDGITDMEDCVIHLATASCEIGDTELDRETAFNTDLIFSFDLMSLSATVTLFHNEFSDYIYQRNTGFEVDGFAIREYAQADTRFSGLEVEADFDLAPDWSLKVFGDVIDSHITGAGDVPRLPPARIGSELQWEAGNWSASLSVQHAFEQDDPGENELATDSYTRWDAGMAYTLGLDGGGELLFFLKGRNLGDEEIRLATSTLRGYAPEPGRSVETGIRWRY